MKDPMERFLSKVNKTDDCWLCTDALVDGYGRFSVNGRTIAAHRWAYEQLVGPIPPGLQLDHLCHTRDVAKCIRSGECTHRRCVNPDHLEPVTSRENVNRGANALRAADDLEKAREAGRRWAQEHPLSDEQRQRLRSLLAESLPEAS